MIIAKRLQKQIKPGTGAIFHPCGVNNHHSVVEFKGQWLLFYHRWLDIDSSCGKQRHSCAEYIHINEDGTIKKVERTDVGVKFPR